MVTVTCEWCSHPATHEVWTANRNIAGPPGRPVGKPKPGRAIWSAACLDHAKHYERIYDMKIRRREES